MNKNKNWVYECLVENDTDPVGFIAYAFYKKSKHDAAKGMRDKGMSEEEISRKVQNHHDTVLQSNELLEGFNARSKTFLTEINSRLKASVKEELQKEYDKKIKELEKKEKKALDTALRQLKNAAKSSPPQNRISKSFFWLLNGFSGVFAAIIMAFLVGGIIYAASPEARKAETKREVITEILNSMGS
ncbi:hypothetical protein [Pseudoalteromonas sp. Z9A6]|uniref:hypothetical protein n=1 Tax=Pseudoalteromonas sp. Z9A6 TaxID=2686352 RepID=UPI0013FE12A8|nr:hypothetical protein [Pseudoalteromonas sp. Z9A6]